MNIHPGRAVMRLIRRLPVPVMALYCLPVAAATPVIEIEIKDHLFYPSEIVIPADTKIKLLITNLDPTPEEFESYELNREKVISGNSKTVIFIGPLPPGEYPNLRSAYIRDDMVIRQVEDDAGTIMVKRYRLVLPGQEEP